MSYMLANDIIMYTPLSVDITPRTKEKPGKAQKGPEKPGEGQKRPHGSNCMTEALTTMS